MNYAGKQVAASFARQCQRFGVPAILRCDNGPVSYNTDTGTATAETAEYTVRGLFQERTNNQFPAEGGIFTAGRQAAIASKDRVFTIPAKAAPVEPLKGMELEIDLTRYSIENVVVAQMGDTLIGYQMTIK